MARCGDISRANFLPSSPSSLPYMATRPLMTFLLNQTRKNAFVNPAVPFEDRQREYFLRREPARLTHFARVEDQFSAGILREPPVEAEAPARRHVLPYFFDRPDYEPDLFHRLARDRRRLVLTGLHFAAHRPPTAAPRPRRSSNEQCFAVLDNDGDDSVDGHNINPGPHAYSDQALRSITLC